MKRVGYVNLDVLDDETAKIEMDAIHELKVDLIVHDEDDLYHLNIDSELFIYELKSLGKSVIQLEQFLPELIDKDIQLIIAKKDSPLNKLARNDLFSVLLEIASSEHHVIRQRTIKGLTEARRKGHLGGRPTISEETIEKIRYLYQNKAYSLRDVASECNVSLGTVYKYVQN